MRTIIVVLFSLLLLAACVPATATPAVTTAIPPVAATTVVVLTETATATPSPAATPTLEWGIAFAALDPRAAEGSEADYPMTLYVVRPNGNDLRMIAASIQSIATLTASPDGHELLLSASLEDTDNDNYASGFDLAHLYRLDIQSGAVFTLTGGRTAIESLPAWSPNGQRIAFASSDVNSPSYMYVTEFHTYLYVINCDGSGKTKVIPQEGQIYSLAWSPTGEQIAFEQNGAVWVVNPNGSNLLKIADAPIKYGLDIYTARPVWSPDGRRIAFAAPGVGEESEPDIFVVNSDGSDLVNITQNSEQDFQPTWSPDGQHIAYISGNWNIYISDIDGNNAMMLSDDTSPESNSPIWSPDGSQLIFVAGRTWLADTQLFVADWPGGAPRQLNENLIVADRPAWILFPSH